MTSTIIKPQQLLGAWTLQSSTQSCDGTITKTFGDPPSGQIQYTADGRMSGFLMDPRWVNSNEPPHTDRFFAYAGRWQVQDHEVHHHVEFCSAPSKIGTVFVRYVSVLDEQSIKLTTKAETSKSGKVYISELVWQRHSV